MAVTTLFGARVRRREDPRLITGRATYTDDLRLPGLTHAVMVRSPHAHARIRAVDTTAARARPGVLAVFTGADLAGKVGAIPTAWLIPNADLRTPPHPPLAVDRVRYVGDAVAVVVAEDRYIARDAAELVRVDYEPLPAVADAEAALRPDAPRLHEEAPGNVAFRWKTAGGDIAAAFARADAVIRQRFVNQRLIPNAIETRAAVADYRVATGELTLWVTSQNPHIHRVILSGVLGIPEHKLRIISPEVGGGFGSKIFVYPDEAVVAFCAQMVGRPVKWTEDRRENYVATAHGRDHLTDVELAVRRDGTVLGLRGRTLANLGAYLSTVAPGIPTILHGLMLPGCYTLEAVDYEVVGVFTNTTPVDAYRGAGRPEATYLIERLMDLAAAELGLDPAEIRRRNFIPKERFPYTIPTGLTYDSGDYARTLDRALELADYAGWRERQRRGPEDGRRIGIGLSTYVEICGMGPSPVAGSTGFQWGLWGSAVVRVHPTGKVNVFVGEKPHGQGEETTFAQIVAEELQIPIEDVQVIYGDTATTPMGWGTYGSRTTVVGGNACLLAARKVLDKARKLAAHLLEAAEADIVYQGGRFYVRGSPERARTFQEVTLQAYLAWNLPQGMEPGLEASSFYDPPNFTYPFGAHVCVVAVDEESGAVEVKRYVAVDDCGRAVNPLIVDGQVHGGIVQGMAQALYEAAVYDANGQLLTGSMLDYAVPKAAQVPAFITDRTETPSPANPLGLKGVGETGTIAAPAAVVNAVCDALRPLGIRHLDMPLTPRPVWAAIQQARTAGGGGS
ncbi:MAG: molybdopterin-dependent oxidoreductase [Armatimonadota bacterium]|nr:molybdopterin-dependent oxidoreductase [Armatimonadota bacterium]MDR7489522.1 molybdopterin-dependent oxidoreductase [Armatimonadota bacterium]MDR7529059.1 molybdopterin-dependent oxidoreductase [Armatimonadota bacterium]MDR7585116.1 molybdopterin-dependent oxidoreductase [Armatimonadota bacterium]